MTSSDSAPAGKAQTTQRFRRPPVAVHYAPSRPPRFPRLMPFRSAGKITGRYLLLTAAFLWIFGGMLFFLLRLAILFYNANQRAIQSVLDHLFH